MGNIHSEDQFMNILFDTLHRGGKYIVQIESHQAELIREENFTDKKYDLSHISRLIIDSSSGSGRNNERKILFIQNERFLELLNILQRIVIKYKK